MYTDLSKGDYESRQKIEKKQNERKKNILVIISKYLEINGYAEISAKLNEDSGLDLDQYELADNIDLYQIVREYEDYFFLRFNKYPKFINKVNDSSNKLLPRIQNKNINKKNQKKKVDLNKPDKVNINNHIENGNLKLELNINPLPLTAKPNTRPNKNKEDNKDTFTFNDHKESVLLKPLPADMPDEL